ncbi:hypothetical protein INE86_02602 [Parabacteroides distasonis]|nr:hypothetical protein INE86_02602 [Parabacteroides distasonis]
MATFKICVRKQRSDGFYPVYIRVTHNRKSSYIKMDKMVDKKGLTRTGEVKDPFVVSFCSDVIMRYVERANKEDISQWDVKTLVEYLEKADEDICFSDYARKYKREMETVRGMARNAKNYELAYCHLERFAGTSKLMFSRFTTKFINDWIKTLLPTARAKEMYPVNVRQIFKAAINEFNDYDRGIIRIKTNPWLKVKIPNADTPDHRALDADFVREFFATPIPPTKMILSLPELARDVALMVFCLAGINTVDLFRAKKSNLKGWTFCYNRAKTQKFRRDKAYMEIIVPDILRPVMEKYFTPDDDEFLFNFHKTYRDDDSFNANMNSGLKRICKHGGLNAICMYNFRHSWGTIARNDIKASMYDVAFCMNHSSAHKTTEIYVRPDYSIVSEINNKVIDFVFNQKRKKWYMRIL